MTDQAATQHVLRIGEGSSATPGYAVQRAIAENSTHAPASGAPLMVVAPEAEETGKTPTTSATFVGAD